MQSPTGFLNFYSQNPMLSIKMPILLLNMVRWVIEFLTVYPKLVTVLHRNQHHQRKFWYLVNKSNGELTKIGHFQSSKSIFEVKYQLNCPEKYFFVRIMNWQNIFFNNIFNFGHFWKTLFSRNVPNLWWLNISFLLQNIKIPFE